MTGSTSPARHSAGGPERVWSLDQVADRYGVSVKTIRREISRGTLLAFRRGQRKLGITESELKRYEQERQVRPMPSTGPSADAAFGRGGGGLRGSLATLKAIEKRVSA